MSAVRIAAIQPALELGAVERNLARVEDLIRDAVREHAPQVVVLPEAATSPNVYAKELRGVVRPVDGAPMQLIRGLARELDVVIGGGFLARRGKDVRGTYALAEPDGRLHLHDKDIPTMWEHNYYAGGDDPGRTWVAALDAPVGVACGWEWARFGTMRRLRGDVHLLLGGMCWPGYPVGGWGPLNPWMRREHALQRQHARALPGQVARLLGVPVAMPSHVGDIRFETPLVPGLPWQTQMVGETQICDAGGTVLARLSFEDGEGHVAADVELATPRPSEDLASRYWIPPLSGLTQVAWHAMNTHGQAKYKALKVLRRHPWQQWPGGDLPDELAPDAPAVATTA